MLKFLGGLACGGLIASGVCVAWFIHKYGDMFRSFK